MVNTIINTTCLVIYLSCFIFVESMYVFQHVEEEDSIVTVAVLYRHGDRTPTSDSWPTDPYYKNDSIFTEGKGQLTNKGKERLYDLGKWFRERYSTFLPTKYLNTDIYVKSTDVDRTLMSAQCNLAGLYPPTANQVWNDALLWQPIPIHTTSRSQDPVLSAKVPCAMHDYLEKQLLNTEEFKLLNSQHAELYKNLSVLTGADINDFRNMSWIYSTIAVHKSYNLTIPSWVDSYFNDISELAGVKFQVATYTPPLARLRTGPFFNYLLTKFSEAAKFYMFSGHDTTLSDVLNSMGAFNHIPPEFGSTIIWEIRKNALNNKYVNTFFKNSTHLEQLKIFGCDTDCDFNDFTTFLQPIAVDVDSWNKECSASQNKPLKEDKKISFNEILNDNSLPQ